MMNNNSFILLRSIAIASAIFFSISAYGQPSHSSLNHLYTLDEGTSKRTSSSDPNWKNGNNDYRQIPAGETLVLAELEGPGIITHFWNTSASNEESYLRLLVLRCYWDGEETPSVESPLSDFFGSGHGMEFPLDSIPVRVTGDGTSRNCYWPMPFRKSAKITITNEGRMTTFRFYYHIDWTKGGSFNTDTAYFHAQYHQEFPTGIQNYPVADIQGRGRYVGTVLSSLQRSAGWWGEGDDFFFIDGERTPSIRGTGTEDYFGEAWGFGEQSGPYYGTPIFWLKASGDLTTSYRWHLPDPISFQKSLRFELENKGNTFSPDGTLISPFTNRNDFLSSVAFWYQIEPHRPFPPQAQGYERLYYDFIQFVNAEIEQETIQASEGTLITHPHAGARDGYYLLWDAVIQEQQSLSIPVIVTEGGTYELLLSLLHAWRHGIFQVLLDDRILEERLDLFLPYDQFIDHSYHPIQLNPGMHKLTFVNQGKHTDSGGLLLGIDGFLLSRRAE